MKHAEYGGFWLRLVAGIIDQIVLVSAVFILGIIVLLVVPSAAGIFETIGRFLGVLIAWIYYARMESSPKQATLGKLALGLKVTDMKGKPITFGRASGRFFGKILSGLILGIGYIMIAFTEKKQGLHDMIADCLVVKK